MAKKIPYEDRTTWQRVQDMQNAMSMSMSVIKNTLNVAWPQIDRPEMQELVHRQLSDALATMQDAAGREE